MWGSPDVYRSSSRPQSVTGQKLEARMEMGRGGVSFKITCFFSSLTHIGVSFCDSQVLNSSTLSISMLSNFVWDSKQNQQFNPYVSTNVLALRSCSKMAASVDLDLLSHPALPKIVLLTRSPMYQEKYFLMPLSIQSWNLDTFIYARFRFQKIHLGSRVKFLFWVSHVTLRCDHVIKWHVCIPFLCNLRHILTNF